MTLAEWITKETSVVVARKLSTTVGCVNIWRRGLVLPRTKLMKLIVELSDGAVSYEEMIETFHSRSNARNRIRFKTGK